MIIYNISITAIRNQRVVCSSAEEPFRQVKPVL